MRTTGPAPFDVAGEMPELAPYARTAVRLHPRRGEPAAGQSSMGGPLLWPVDEAWPACDGPGAYDHFDGSPGEDGVPLVPVLQLLAEDVPELPFPEATGWPYEDELGVVPGTKVGGYPGWTQGPEWPECRCGRTRDHLLTVASWEFSRGDDRRWIPLEDRPAMAGWGFDAPDDHPWRAVQNPAGLMLGDAGGISLFECRACPERPFGYRFDCS
ncbi:hypothetical protein AB0J83_35395 [Actinoplanes sp. NPDC049596]|uniref:hypothetical protein n=1 Tax=unclassified Actinoplanes TaxID=2626549 RepID=UPI00343A5142